MTLKEEGLIMETNTLSALEKQIYVLGIEVDGISRSITKQLSRAARKATTIDEFRHLAFESYLTREAFEDVSMSVLYSTASDYEDWLENEFDAVPAGWELDEEEEKAYDQLWWFEFYRIQADLEQWLTLHLIRRIREDVRFIPPVIKENPFLLSDDAKHVFLRLLQRSVAKPSAKLKVNDLTCEMGLPEVARYARISQQRVGEALEELLHRGVLRIEEGADSLVFRLSLPVV